jgi:hypothetical protein
MMRTRVSGRPSAPADGALQNGDHLRLRGERRVAGGFTSPLRIVISDELVK